VSCDACDRSRRAVRPDCSCCPDTVVVADDTSCLDELPFTEEQLQQLVERQATATCKSVQATAPSLHVVIRAQTPTTDADVGGCPRRVCQPRAVDVVEQCSQAVVCESGDECLTRWRVVFSYRRVGMSTNQLIYAQPGYHRSLNHDYVGKSTRCGQLSLAIPPGRRRRTT